MLMLMLMLMHCHPRHHRRREDSDIREHSGDVVFRRGEARGELGVG